MPFKGFNRDSVWDLDTALRASTPRHTPFNTQAPYMKCWKY